MIAIVNVGGDQLGVCKYEVRINKKVVGEFEHNRVDGLTVCIEKAAKAVERHKWIEGYGQLLGGDLF